MEILICSFYLIVAARAIVWAEQSLRCTIISLGRLSNQPTTTAALLPLCSEMQLYPRGSPCLAQLHWNRYTTATWRKGLPPDLTWYYLLFSSADFCGNSAAEWIKLSCTKSLIFLIHVCCDVYCTLSKSACIKIPDFVTTSLPVCVELRSTIVLNFRRFC